jgi:3-phenylpropionate/cinnamic acid dioxygenase small subunit
VSHLDEAVSVETQLAVERLLAYEAYLLDERRFADWLDLFTEDGTYSISVRELAQPPGEQNPSAAVAEPPLVNEPRDYLVTRVRRLDTRLAHAEQPPSLTRHLVTNVLILEDRGVEARVASSFQVYQARLDISESIFFGKRDDLLRRVDGKWRIARRHAVLDASLLPRTLTIFF